jgi:hypothetical protein
VGQIALVTWDGGGNVAVTVAIAVALRARGHAVTVLGPRSLQSAVEPLALRYAELGIIPPDDPEQRMSYLLRKARTQCSLSSAALPRAPMRWSSTAT